MNAHDKLATPDFLVHWHNASLHLSEDIYCDPAVDAAFSRASDKLRNAVATLNFQATHIEISELAWAEPTTLTFTPNRAGFVFIITSSVSIEYGYPQESAKSVGVGRIFFMLPGRELHANMTPGTMRTITCSFEQAYAESILGPLDGLSRSQLLNSLDVRSSLISAILLRLMHETLHPGPLSDTVIASFGHTMLVEYAHCLSTDAANPETGGRLTARDFGIIEEYLAGLSGEAPSVAALAAACGFSERYFAKLFREQTGCSVAQYIKSAQIAKAKTYLLETDLPLKEIAYRLGFSTPGNFSFAFRAATGATPGQFRKVK